MGKILLIFADANSIHTQRWAYAMHNRGMQVHIISRYHADLAQDIAVYPLQSDTQGNKKSKLYLLWRILHIPFMVKKINPHIVNPHFLSSYGLLGGLSNWRPLHLTAWGSDILQVPHKKPYVKLLLKMLFYKANSYNSDSQAVMDGIYGTYTQKKGDIIKWGTDTTIFTPQPKPPMSEPQGVFTIFSNRSWERLYNIDVILQAYALFRTQYHKPSCLKVAGFGTMESHLKSMAGESVHFIGTIPTESAMATTLHNSHLYISIPETDSGGISVVEALATDTPTIVSDIDGNAPFDTTKTPINAQDLAEKMYHIANNYDIYTQIHKKIGKHIRKNNNRTIFMDKAFAILNNI